MLSLYSFVGPPGTCGYLADREWTIEYEVFLDIAAAEYGQRMLEGWRRFGAMVFRPRCPNCTLCRSLRIPVETFAPNRSQRRARKANADVTLAIRSPSVSREKLDLFDRYHAHQSETRGWPVQPPKNAAEYRQSFADNPFPTEEWRYHLGSRLVGVGYVDVLPQGLSAIYFYHEPELRDRSLGTFNVLSLIAETRRRRLPHLYLGYFVEGCGSLEYKATFRPNEIRMPDGQWAPFRT